MRKSMLLLLALIATFVDSQALGVEPPTTTYTIEEAYRMALGTYELVGAARERVEQARQQRRVATSLLLPTLYNQSVYTHNLVSAVFEFSGQSIDILPPNDYNIAFVLSQPIFSGRRLLKGRQQADVGVDVAGKSYVTTVQDTLLGVTRAYYAVLAIEENIDITRRSVEVTQETLRTAESLYRAGESVETSVLRARVAHSNAERELVEARNNLEIAKRQFSLLTGIEGDFELSRPGKPGRPSGPLEQLIAQGIENRAELQSLKLQRRLAELQIDRQRGQYFPDITLDGTFIKRRSNFPSTTLSSVSLNANWVLFDGFRRAAQVASAKSQLRELELRRRLLEEQVEQEVRTACLNIDTQAAGVEMLERQVEFARRNAQFTQQAYRVGEATDLDVLTANETLTRSERQLALATYQLELAIYELERAIGTFAKDFIPGPSGGDK